MRSLSVLSLALVIACDSGKPKADPSPAPAPAPKANPWLEPVLDSELSCKVDEDCGEVGPTCDGCCDRAPIAKQHIAAYMARKETRCAAYHGSICTCEQQAHHSKCENDRCTIVWGTRRP